MGGTVVLIETTAGLPNTCTNCGRPIDAGMWYAPNEDAARAGGGVCGRKPCVEAVDGIMPAQAAVPVTVEAPASGAQPTPTASAPKPPRKKAGGA